MKISNMDGDWQKKKLRGVCGECQSPNCNRVGCTPSDVTIQDAPIQPSIIFSKSKHLSLL